MKKMKSVLAAFLAVMILVCDMQGVVLADSVEGRTESQAIGLTLGKAKTAKFLEGTKDHYFWVSINSTGKLKLSFSGKSIGTDVTVTLYKKGEYMWEQSKTFKYNKSKKTTSGNMTSEYILPTGGYIIRVTPKSSEKAGKKFSLTAKFVKETLDDVEPNNNESTAQPMKVLAGKKAVTYKMMLSNLLGLGQEDIIDCFSFKLSKAKKIQIKLNQKNKNTTVKLLVLKKTEEGFETIHTLDVPGGKLSKKLNLEKGTYCLKVLYDGANAQNRQQVPYTISASVI